MWIQIFKMEGKQSSENRNLILLLSSVRLWDKIKNTINRKKFVSSKPGFG